MHRGARLAAIGIGICLGIVGVWQTAMTRAVEVGQWLQQASLRQAGLRHEHAHTAAGKVHYYVGGDGPTVALVHGLTDRGAGWYQVVPYLVKDHRVVVIDLPGHGNSPVPTDGITLDALVEGVVAVLADVSPGEPVSLIGNSMGGWVGLRIAVEEPERLDRLVLVNSAGLWWPVPRESVLPADRAGVRAKIEAVTAGKGPALPPVLLDQLVRYHQRPQFAALFDSIGDDDYVDGRLAHVTVPADLVWGTEDPWFPLSYAGRLRDRYPGAQLHALQGCGHAPQVTCAAALAEVLDRVL